MFNKVLIAEDHEIANLSLQKVLESFASVEAKYVYYCDDALAWISSALRSGEPYDLLITDLSFEDDGNKQKIQSGYELIRAVKVIQPDIKIIVFSGEERSAVIGRIFKELCVDGYVRKARRDGEQLRAALQAVYKGEKYISIDIKQSLKQSNAFEFLAVDIEIVRLLSLGVLQKEIPGHLKAKQISPSGLSSIEKRLNAMREGLGFSKNEQLVSYLKDKGFI